MALVVSGGNAPEPSPRLSTKVTCPTGQEHVAGITVDVYFHEDVNAGPRDAGWTEEAMSQQLSPLGSNPALVSQTKPGIYLVVYDFANLNAAAKRLFRKKGDNYAQLYANGFFLGDKVFFQAKVSDPLGESVHLEVTVAATEATVTKGNPFDIPDVLAEESIGKKRRLAGSPSLTSTPVITESGATGASSRGHISTHLISKIGSDAVAHMAVAVYHSSDLIAGPRDDGTWTLVNETQLSVNGGNDDLVQEADLKAGLFMIVYDFGQVNSNAASLYIQEEDATYQQLNPNGFFLGNKFTYVVKYAEGGQIHLVLSVSDTAITARPGVRSH